MTTTSHGTYKHFVDRPSKTMKNFRFTDIHIDIFATVLTHKNLRRVTTSNSYFKQTITNPEYTAQNGVFIRNNVSSNIKTS